LLFFNLLYWTSCLVVYFKYGFNISILIIINLIFVIFLWFKDITKEGLRGFHNFYVQDGFKYGIILFIFSEFIFFFSIFWAFFDISISPSADIGGSWPPYGLIIINPFGIPFLNTCILLSSGVSVTWCHYSILSNYSGGSSLILTIFLALFFVSIQGIEYHNLFFTIRDRAFGGIFFFSTGFHGLHVIFGSLFLMVNIFRLLWSHFIFNHHLGFEFSILYWHFVDVVWLFLFVFVYWWSY